MKMIKKLYAIFSYVVVFLVVFSFLLNVISFIVNYIFHNNFTVDYWEILLIPLVILISIKYYHPFCPK